MCIPSIFQPTRPLRGATEIKQLGYGPRRTFQPTRPLRGATAIFASFAAISWGFQPTRPLRGATQRMKTCTSPGRISTHAPLAGRDREGKPKEDNKMDFNPRAPCGARLLTKLCKIKSIHFNPRAPCGARLDNTNLINKDENFNPRAPCGARHLNPSAFTYV